MVCSPILPNLDFHHQCFTPIIEGTLGDQLTNCYQQLAEYSFNDGYSKESILKQTIFISVRDDTEYHHSKQKLLACAKDFFVDLPPTSILAQSPEDSTLMLEAVFVAQLQLNELIHKHNEDSSWLVFQRGGTKMLIAAGLSETSIINNILQQSQEAFRQLYQILTEENMQFSDIVRQWNYIEQITQTVNHLSASSQHYQIFNDVRSKFYQLADFKNGFPAATGIGIDCGGIIIDVIAVQHKSDQSVISVKSPVQLDAYHYSKEVLAENHSMSDFSRTTPKFERAKILYTQENKLIFISGTAAISGEESSSQLSVEQQTERTIENIFSLISIENLQRHGIMDNEKASLNYLRVYVKYKKDLQTVKNICIQYFANIPVVYVVADICRPELLVEIEAQAKIDC